MSLASNSWRYSCRPGGTLYERHQDAQANAVDMAHDRVLNEGLFTWWHYCRRWDHWLDMLVPDFDGNAQ
jgi:hypothetical protein